MGKRIQLRLLLLILLVLLSVVLFIYGGCIQPRSSTHAMRQKYVYLRDHNNAQIHVYEAKYNSSQHLRIAQAQESHQGCAKFIRNTFKIHSKCNLTDQDLASVDTFVLFAGWQRSGHSIIGSLLDAHPNVIIAHEYFLLSSITESHFTQTRKDLFRALCNNSYRNTYHGYRTNTSNTKGYNIGLPNSWQGRFQELKVIGDKTGGDTTRAFASNPQKFTYLIRWLQNLVRVPIKFICVIRNPYDIIATLTLYRASGIKDAKVNATEDNKYDDLAVLGKATRDIIRQASALHGIMMHHRLDIIPVFIEEFIENPKKVMSDLCAFLQLECPEDYLQQCADKAFKTVSKSRNLVKWSPAINEFVDNAIHRFPFFRKYSDSQIGIS